MVPILTEAKEIAVAGGGRLQGAGEGAGAAGGDDDDLMQWMDSQLEEWGDPARGVDGFAARGAAGERKNSASPFLENPDDESGMLVHPDDNVAVCNKNPGEAPCSDEASPAFSQGEASSEHGAHFSSQSSEHSSPRRSDSDIVVEEEGDQKFEQVAEGSHDGPGKFSEKSVNNNRESLKRGRFDGEDAATAKTQKKYQRFQ